MKLKDNQQEYKGFVAEFTVSFTDMLIVGKVVNAGKGNHVIFHGDTPVHAIDRFRDIVETYIAACVAEGDDPTPCAFPSQP